MIRILDSTLEDVYALAQDLRPLDALESKRLGQDPLNALLISFNRSVYSKTGFVNNNIAAMWGVCGTPLGLQGQPYLITGHAIQEISPLQFARIYKNEVSRMKQLFPVLENYVDSSYIGAVRMLRIAGFEISPDPVLFGDSQFNRFYMRAL